MTASVTPQRRSELVEAWLALVKIFGTALTARDGEELPDGWVMVLADLPNHLIAVGVERCRRGEHEADPRRRRFAPNPVGFRALCEPTPEAWGLPKQDDALREAVFLACDSVNGNPVTPSHPAVWHAAHETGLQLLASDYEAGRKRFAYVWPITVRAVMEGRELTAIPEALPPPKDEFTPPPPEVRAAALAQMRKGLDTPAPASRGASRGTTMSAAERAAIEAELAQRGITPLPNTQPATAQAVQA